LNDLLGTFVENLAATKSGIMVKNPFGLYFWYFIKLQVVYKSYGQVLTPVNISQLFL